MRQRQRHSTARSCSRPLSRASRQLFRRDASPILLHYFGGRGPDAPWRRNVDAPPSSSSEAAADDDRGRRRREAIPLVDDPDDGLSDEEWYALLGFAIDESMPEITSEAAAATTVEPRVCPLHPKHDALLGGDRTSHVVPRRYRAGAAKFGSHSLPQSGRAARAALWAEEREAGAGGRRRETSARPQPGAGSSVFLFQCGACSKTFVSRYYLDKHVDAHHPAHDGADTDDAGNPLLCPADRVCGALGGAPSCVEVMQEISEYYGRGLLLGRDYEAPAGGESLYSSLMKRVHRDREDSPVKKMQMKRQQEREMNAVLGEMRHRASMRNRLVMQAVLRRKMERISDDDGDSDTGSEDGIPTVSSLVDEALSGEITSEGGFDRAAASTTPCNEQEMERSYRLCRDMMTTCFGGGTAIDAEEARSGHAQNLAEDLITQLCEPMHCRRRLHRMAGHDQRHAVHWNDEWEEHHAFALGWCGWAVVAGLALFYGYVYGSGMGKDLLSEEERRKKKS